MKVITAIEEYKKESYEVSCFLAGGISKCWEWQDAVIKYLKEIDSKRPMHDLVLFNPRRANFPINDPNASEEQICWEFKNLQEMDIFSMYFCGNTESDQPICFYELGRNLNIMNERYLSNSGTTQKYPMIITAVSPSITCIVTCESDFRRIKDVDIQTKLAIGNKYHANVFSVVDISESREAVAKFHAQKIAANYFAFLNLHRFTTRDYREYDSRVINKSVVDSEQKMMNDKYKCTVEDDTIDRCPDCPKGSIFE